jgi:hypothetical protein
MDEVDFLNESQTTNPEAEESKHSHAKDVENAELLGFRTLSIVRILIITRKKNKHDVSETGSVSVLR